jgi:hypothetical protein
MSLLLMSDYIYSQSRLPHLFYLDNLTTIFNNISKKLPTPLKYPVDITKVNNDRI